MKLLILLVTILSSTLAALDTQWWRHTIIYQILPYSFKDSNGDGIGDLKGIISKLDYFVDLKVKTLHLNPIYDSPLKDMGYDITDYYQIHPYYGTMEDFEELVAEMNKRDMKLIMDLVINHSSSEHEWFQNSVQKIDPYTNFYVWMDARGFRSNGKPIPPNNWRSVFGGSAWTWNEERQQFYFHQFLKDQPDFNLYNPYLKVELKKIIKFWLDKGVAGFRIDAAMFLFEDFYLRDDNNQLRQFNQDETYDFIHEMRYFLDQYSYQKKDFERIFIAEAHTDNEHVLRYYDAEDYPITQYPYAFQLEYIFKEINAEELNSMIEPWLKQIPQNAVSLWMTQDHDGKRVGSRIRPEYSDILTMVSMMLPGAVGVYYGQEIGMTNGQEILPEQRRDFSGFGTRDPTRLPMQWDSTYNAGFTTNESPFLPPSMDFTKINVDFQQHQQFSHLKMFNDLSALRQTDVAKKGDFQTYLPSKDVYIFTRSYENVKLAIIVNLGHLPFPVNLAEISSESPRKASVAAASVNAAYQKGFELDGLLKPIVMTPLSSLVVKLDYGDNTLTDSTSSPNDTGSIVNQSVEIGTRKENEIAKIDKKVVRVPSRSSNGNGKRQRVRGGDRGRGRSNNTDSNQIHITVRVSNNKITIDNTAIRMYTGNTPLIKIEGSTVYLNDKEYYKINIPLTRVTTCIYTIITEGITTEITAKNTRCYVEQGKYSTEHVCAKFPMVELEHGSIFLDGWNLSEHLRSLKYLSNS